MQAQTTYKTCLRPGLWKVIVGGKEVLAQRIRYYWILTETDHSSLFTPPYPTLKAAVDAAKDLT